MTLAQWCVANNAILYKLVTESKLDASNILDYLSYTTKICELIQRYILVSVLLYERNYRQLQSQNSFRWGTDVPHLQNVHLIPRLPKPTPGTSYKTHPSQPKKPHNPVTLDGKTICRLYNSKGGCHLRDCKYVHQCSVQGCHQAHSAVAHDHSKN